MSRVITYNTATKAGVLSYLGAGEKLTAEQHRVLGMVRERAEAAQENLDAQGLDWGLPIPEALDHLLEGRADSTAEYAAGAYARALYSRDVRTRPRSTRPAPTPGPCSASST
ncbi:hypothetical protein ABZW15_18565 [Streptomyces cellulosae]